jgi:hypothetical protein
VPSLPTYHLEGPREALELVAPELERRVRNAAVLAGVAQLDALLVELAVDDHVAGARQGR